MPEKIDYSFANNQQIAADLAQRLVNLRLAYNLTQTELALEAGVSPLTIHNLEAGKTVSLDTFIRVLRALNLLPNLEALLPSMPIRPIERVARSKRERKRASGTKTAPASSTPWTWGKKE